MLKDKIEKIVKFIFSIIVCEIVGFFSFINYTFERGVHPMVYKEPIFFKTPYFVLPIFFLAGIAIYLIWTKCLDRKKLNTLLVLFGFQLILDVFYSDLFSYYKEPGWNGTEIPVFWVILVLALLWIIAISIVVKFYKVSKTAALLLLPYLLLVLLVTYDFGVVFSRHF